jgi:hypothetical protein
VDNNYMYLGMNKSGFVHTLPGGMLRLTLGRIFQVQVATLFALVQMKSGRECLVWPPRSGETSRLCSRDQVANGVKCGPHGGKKSKTKSWTRVGAG